MGLEDERSGLLKDVWRLYDEREAAGKPPKLVKGISKRMQVFIVI